MKTNCNYSSNLDFTEGVCGICHSILEQLSYAGFTVESMEHPGGVSAFIKDPSGSIIGKGDDITWAPAILDAQINSGIIDSEVAAALKPFLTDREDQKRVASMSGYGRVVTSASMIISELWDQGGCVEIERKGPGIRAILHGNDGDEISSAASGFCPVCSINIAASRIPSLRTKISKLQRSKNTGQRKFERGIVNSVKWKRRRIHAELIEDGEVIGKNWGCCIAYATLRAEIDAGFGSRRWNKLLKNYCDLCPLKHFWLNKPMGALGNRILHRMGRVGVRELVRMDDYITVDIISNHDRVACGIGTLCSFSATVNAFLKSDASLILKPDSADGFPYSD